MSGDPTITPSHTGPIAVPLFSSGPVEVPGDARDPSKRLLFISYAFPPTGGGGVQRSVKFTKYLPLFGWNATVLTAANPSVPVQDHDLQVDLDPSTKILRAKTWEPSYSLKARLRDSGKGSKVSLRGLLRRAGMHLLQPDPQVLWNHAAMRTATNELRINGHDAIYATGPPFSSFLLGRALKRRFGLPLILDFRDEWLLASQHLENYQIGRLAYRRQRSMLRKVLKAADAVITTTQASAEEIAWHCDKAGNRASVTCIYNGYDEDDFALDRVVSSPSNMLRLAYTGTLWKLTDATPVVTALERLAAMSPDTAARVQWVLAGRRTPDQESAIRRLEPTPVTLECHDYLPHGRCLELAASAQVLVLLLADEPGAQRVVPAKLFEYLALNKTVLAVCPSGETAELLRQNGQTNVFHPTETDRIAGWLMEQVRKRSVLSESDCNPSAAIERFSRRELTGQLASLLGSVVSHR